MTRVVVLEEIHADGLALLASAPGVETVEGWRLDRSALLAALAPAEAMLVRISRLDAEMIAAAPGLKVISKHGVGCDNIDLAAARAAGVPVTVTAGANDLSVAEHTLALMLAAAKRLPEMGAIVRGDYRKRGAILGADLAGRRVLILGYGRIGRRVAPLCRAFGMGVTLFDPALTGRAEADGYPVAASLAEGLTGADVLTIHVPSDAATRGLIGADELRQMAPGAIVVNCARGGIVDEAAVAALSAEGHLGGVAFDVFSEEPIRPDNPLLSIPGAVLTPHTGAMSVEAMRRMGVQSAQNVLDGLVGRIDPAALFRPGP